jgi:large subunit ribosomal protein L33
MSKDNLVKLVSEPDENGVGGGHIYYTHKNTDKLKEKLELKKYNPIARTHTVYKEEKL